MILHVPQKQIWGVGFTRVSVLFGFCTFWGLRVGRLLVLFCIPLVELKFDIVKGYGVYAKPGIAKK